MTAATIAVAVVVESGRVLVGVRPHDADDAAGKQEFPGGKLEAGETPAAAAARECREETGIDVVAGDVIDVATTTGRCGRLEVVFVAAAARPDAPPPTPPFRWLPIESLDAALFPAANARVIQLLRAGCGGACSPTGCKDGPTTAHGGS